MAYTKTVWVNDSKPAINADNLNKIELGIEANDAAITSTTKNYTLSASSWSDGSYTISDNLITATSNQEVMPAVGITLDQLKALQTAMLVDGGQSAGSLTLKAMGTAPTINIPIRIIFRGVK